MPQDKAPLKRKLDVDVDDHEATRLEIWTLQKRQATMWLQEVC